MEYLGFIFGIFGFMAYLQLSSLKKRVGALEEEGVVRLAQHHFLSRTS